jgi:hypothetical protein
MIIIDKWTDRNKKKKKKKNTFSMHSKSEFTPFDTFSYSSGHIGIHLFSYLNKEKKNNKKKFMINK